MHSRISFADNYHPLAHNHPMNKDQRTGTFYSLVPGPFLRVIFSFSSPINLGTPPSPVEIFFMTLLLQVTITDSITYNFSLLTNQ